MTATNELYLKSSAQSISELENYLESLLKKNYISVERYAEILISLTEAVNNAIIHGNKNDERKVVVVQCVNKTSGFSFIVKDQGKGFDPANIPDPTLEDQIECCGGRGVHIMKQLSDKIDFKNNGRVVEMYFENCKSVM
ncbi:MAG TPA: ATP-binding protein [Saprospiraceae bacterium]|nr:ATP-binding protein [Saprospiraceae bacterium]